MLSVCAVTISHVASERCCIAWKEAFQTQALYKELCVKASFHAMQHVSLVTYQNLTAHKHLPASLHM